MIAAFLLDENLDSYSLQSVATRYLGAPNWKASWEPYKKTLSSLSFLPDDYKKPLKEYNDSDIHWTAKLYNYSYPQLCQSRLEKLFLVEMENLKTLARMTEQGIQIDQRLLNEWTKQYTTEREHLASSFNFNPESPGQILVALREQGYNVGSTGVEILTKLDGELPKRIIAFRAIGKILSTYLGGLQNHIFTDGRIHSGFHQHRTVSGRLSSSDPNGQNFPRDTSNLPYRRLFLGPFTRADFNQLELRIAGQYSGGNLLDVYRAGKDIHSTTGERIWSKRREQITENERVVAKVTNFTALYDPFATAIGSVKIQCEEAGAKLSWGDAAHIVESFRRAYPEWWLYVARVIRQVYDKGQVRAPSGRIRRSPLSQGQLFPYGPPSTSDTSRFFGWCKQYDASGKKLEQEVLRSIVNSLVQGLGADITKLVGTVIDRLMTRKGLKSRLCNNVHDELLVWTAEGEEQEVARTLYEAATHPPVQTAFGFTLQVPLEVEIGYGETWSDAKKKENIWKLKDLNS